MFQPIIRILLFVSWISVAAPSLAICTGENPESAEFPESLVLSVTEYGVHSAWYDDATDRYSHGVLGDAIEPSTLVVKDNHDCTRSIVLDIAHVFEDVAPRLAKIDDTPGDEIVTIRSHRNYGAQIAIYQLSEGEIRLLATTPYIGTANRWLAPVGIADFNKDGKVDIAFVDRPHLAKTLRIWSYHNGELEEVASKTGYSNHRIGENFISGGIKTCGDSTTMITADASWRRILETAMQKDRLVTTDIGAFSGKDSLNEALLCNGM